MAKDFWLMAARKAELTDDCSLVVLVGVEVSVFGDTGGMVSVLNHVHVVSYLTLLEGLLEDVDVCVVFQIHAAINY